MVQVIAGDATIFTLAGDAGAPAAAISDPSGLDLREKEHVGMIFLDKVGEGKYVLTNIETQECVPLQDGVWEFVEDDGFYAAVRGAVGADGLDHEGPSSNIVLMDDVFTRPAFVSDLGETYVKKAKGTTGRTYFGKCERAPYEAGSPRPPRTPRLGAPRRTTTCCPPRGPRAA